MLKHSLELDPEHFYTHFVLACSYKVKRLLDLAVGEHEKGLEARDIMVPFCLN